MPVIDHVVLFVYFAGITLFGLWLSKHIKTSDGYFRGERKFKWWTMIGQAFGTGTHAEMPVAQAGATYIGGFSTIWYQWKNMLITPFYWILAPVYRRSERTTVAEIIEDRYGTNHGLIYAFFSICFFIFSMGAMLQGAGKVISVASNNMISSNGVVVVMTLAFLLYSYFGGMVASAHTNFIQAILIIVLSMLLIPFGLIETGGFRGMRTVLPEDFFRVFSDSSGLDTFTIAMLALNGMVGITAQPHMVSMCATGNTERAGRIGQTFGSLVKRLCSIGWALTGLIVAALAITRGISFEDPEQAFGYASRELLLPGLTGLMMSAIVAANMSTCSNFMVNTGALFTHNLYFRYINTGASDQMLLRIGRVSGLLLALLGVVFALTIKNVLHAFLFIETIAAFMGIIFLGGIIWKRANRYGAMAALILSFGSYYLINYLQFDYLTLVYNWTAGPFGWAMLFGCTGFILVSLVTPPEPEDRINAIFEGYRRISDKGTDANNEKPMASEFGEDLLLVDLPGWFRKDRWKNFGKRYREGIIGLLLSSLVVALLILSAWALMQIGK